MDKAGGPRYRDSPIALRAVTADGPLATPVEWFHYAVGTDQDGDCGVSLLNYFHRLLLLFGFCTEKYNKLYLDCQI